MIWAEQISTEGTTEKNGKERKKNRGKVYPIGLSAGQRKRLRCLHPKGYDCGEVDGKYHTLKVENRPPGTRSKREPPLKVH